MKIDLPRWAYTLALTVGVCNASAWKAHAQTSPDQVRDIRWYYIPLSAFVRYGIDSFNIRAKYTLAGRVRHPSAFLQRVDRALRQHPAAPSQPFGHTQVRMLFDITYANGRTERLQVDAARSVFWHHQVYRADSTAEAVLVSALTRKQQRDARVGRYAVKRRYQSGPGQRHSN